MERGSMQRNWLKRKSELLSSLPIKQAVQAQGNAFSQLMNVATAVATFIHA